METARTSVGRHLFDNAEQADNHREQQTRDKQSAEQQMQLGYWLLSLSPPSHF